MLTPDDKIWIRTIVELGIYEIVQALKGDGLIAAHNFRIAYREKQKEWRSQEESK